MNRSDLLYRDCHYCKKKGFNVDPVTFLEKRYMCPTCSGARRYQTNDIISRDTKYAQESRRNWDMPWDEALGRRLTYEEVRRKTGQD